MTLYISEIQYSVYRTSYLYSVYRTSYFRLPGHKLSDITSPMGIHAGNTIPALKNGPTLATSNSEKALLLNEFLQLFQRLLPSSDRTYSPRP